MTQAKTKIVEEVLAQSNVLLINPNIDEKTLNTEISDEIHDKTYQQTPDDGNNPEKWHSLTLKIPNKNEVLGDATKLLGNAEYTESKTSLFSDIENDDMATSKHLCCVS